MDLTPLAVSFATFFGIYLILALSMNLEYGLTGLPNFGKVFFYSVGAYLAAFVASRLMLALAGSELVPWSAEAAVLREQMARAEPWTAALVFLLSLVLAAVVGGFLGYLLSYPALRVRDVYLALVLLVVAEISRVYVRATEGFIGGPHGLGGIPNPFSFVPAAGTRGLLYAGLVLILAALAYLLVQRITHSPFGRLMKAVRDDELAARALGKQTQRVKAQVMAVGSAMAAVAGVLYAFFTEFVGTEDFLSEVTFVVLLMVILGGAGNHRGAVLGTLVMTAIDRFTRPSFLALLGINLAVDINYARHTLIGLLLVLLILYRPRGLFPEGRVQTPAREEVHHLHGAS